MIKIGLSGKMRSGKTTVAEELKKLFKGEDNTTDVRRESIADGLKEMCLENLGRKDRDTLQKFGTDLIVKEGQRIIGPEMKYFWVNQLLALIECENYFADVVIVDDVRFPHEFHALQAKGFKTYRLYVTPAGQLARDGGKELTGTDHASETAFDSWDEKYGVQFDGWFDTEALTAGQIARFIYDDLLTEKEK